MMQQNVTRTAKCASLEFMTAFVFKSAIEIHNNIHKAKIFIHIVS